MTYLQAAETILKQAGARLHHREITRRVLREGPETSGGPLARLKTDLGLSWETGVQLQHRLIWLAACGVVERRNGTWWPVEEAC